MAENKRLLELALKGLEQERRRLDEEMAEVKRRLGGGDAPAVAKKTRGTSAKKTRKPMSAARKKAMSKRMKQIWAERRKAQ